VLSLSHPFLSPAPRNYLLLVMPELGGFTVSVEMDDEALEEYQVERGEKKISCYIARCVDHVLTGPRILSQYSASNLRSGSNRIALWSTIAS
jgi:hypothetical protein